MAGALSGLKVVDLSRVLAGPLCTQMLADHGAEVIKVEPPSGDETRHLGPPFDDNGQAAYFGAVNRGKRAITLDLTQPDARATLEALLEEADILVEIAQEAKNQEGELSVLGSGVVELPRRG